MSVRAYRDVYCVLWSYQARPGSGVVTVCKTMDEADVVLGFLNEHGDPMKLFVVQEVQWCSDQGACDATA
jgi:hypothetical protein